MAGLKQRLTPTGRAPLIPELSTASCRLTSSTAAGEGACHSHLNRQVWFFWHLFRQARALRGIGQALGRLDRFLYFLIPCGCFRPDPTRRRLRIEKWRFSPDCRVANIRHVHIIQVPPLMAGTPHAGDPLPAHSSCGQRTEPVPPGPDRLVADLGARSNSRTSTFLS